MHGFAILQFLNSSLAKFLRRLLMHIRHMLADLVRSRSRHLSFIISSVKGKMKAFLRSHSRRRSRISMKTKMETNLPHVAHVIPCHPWQRLRPLRSAMLKALVRQLHQLLSMAIPTPTTRTLQPSKFLSDNSSNLFPWQNRLQRDLSNLRAG